MARHPPGDAEVERAIDQVYGTLDRKRSHGRRLDECAKEARAAFVSHFLATEAVTRRNTEFWDLGSGIGNVVIQVALQVGCPSYGVEIQRHNHEVATELWQGVRRRMRADADADPVARFICASLTSPAVEARMAAAARKGRRLVVWMNNKLMPDAVVLAALEMLLRVLTTPGSVVLTTKELFPQRHGRVSRGFRAQAARLAVSELPYPADWVEWGAAGRAFVYRAVV